MNAPTLETRAAELRRTGSSYGLIARTLGITKSRAETLTRRVVVEAEYLRDSTGAIVPKWNESRRVAP
jgi:hypothetical protein